MIINEIKIFLDSTIHNSCPTKIITIERKGTALLRSYLDNDLGGKQCPLTWHNVLSTVALENILSNNPGKLAKERILLIDDTVHTGTKMRTILDKLVDKGIRKTNLVRAAFAIHEDCTDENKPEYYFYSQVGRKEFEYQRSSLIDYFSRCGSLLLDTEHIEIPLEIHCTKSEFFRAFHSLGNTVQTLSMNGKARLTITDIELPNKDEFQNRLPKGTVIDRVVKKVRIVEKNRNQYSIIPIYLPSIPIEMEDDWYRFLPPYLCKLIGTYKNNFYLIGLFSSMELIKSIFGCLHNLLSQGKVTASLPEPGTAEDTLSHLLALFPDLDINALHSYIRTLIEEGRSKYKRHFARRKGGVHLIDNRDYDLRGFIRDLGIEVWKYSQYSTHGPNGGTYHEIINSLSSNRFKKEIHKQPLLSAALDRAIDDALVVTNVDKAFFRDRSKKALRIFEPDSELVTKKIRDYVSLNRY